MPLESTYQSAWEECRPSGGACWKSPPDASPLRGGVFGSREQHLASRV